MATSTAVKCLKCGTELDHSVTFCSNCGTKRISSSQKKKSNIIVKLLVFAVIGFVGLSVVGCFAAIAIPKFTVASYKAKSSEFTVVLSQIYTAQEAYQAETRTFATTEELLSSGLSIQSSTNFEYTVENVTDSTFLAVATVKNSFGEAQVGDRATIDHNGVKDASPSLQKYVPTW